MSKIFIHLFFVMQITMRGLKTCPEGRRSRCNFVFSVKLLVYVTIRASVRAAITRPLIGTRRLKIKVTDPRRFRRYQASVAPLTGRNPTKS